MEPTRAAVAVWIEKEKRKPNLMKTRARLGDERRLTNQKARPDGHRNFMTE
jgi:hypothetical protein